MSGPAVDAGNTDVRPAIVDADDLELANAKAAAEAEKGGGQADGEDLIEGADADPNPADFVPGKPSRAAPVMIPKGRFDEATTKLQRERDEALQREAYLAGQIEAMKALQQQPGQPDKPAAQQPPARTVDQIQQEIEANATKFDNGEITYAEMKKIERQLEREERELTAPKPAAAASSEGDKLYLDTLTAQIEKDHPYITLIQSPADFEFLKRKAAESLAAEGWRNPGGDMGAYQYRLRIAEMADQYGEMLTGTKLLPANGKPAPTGQPAPRSPQAAAREAKLDLAADLPPDIARMGTAGDGASGQLSDEQIMAMTDDELANLPTATRRKLLGSS